MPVSTDADTARLWEEFCWRHLTLRSRKDAVLRSAIAADPGFAMGHAAAAWLATMDGLAFSAQDELAAARAGRADHDWERSFVNAVGVLVTEGTWASRDAWLRHQERFPGDRLGFAMNVFLIGYGCDPVAQSRAELARRHRRTADVVGEDDVFLLGFSAMQAQEAGDLERCHDLAARALFADPAGFSGGHPMAHVFYESGSHGDGAAWLDPWLSSADQESTFLGHLQWHSALHHLALGDSATTLRRLAKSAAAQRPGRLFDGTSLLWRCQLHGVVPRAADPTSPSLATAAAGLVDSVPFTFAGVHVALGLATAGDADGLRRLGDRARSSAVPGAAAVLPPLADALAAYLDGEPARSADRLLTIEPWFARIGGSHAQREVLEDTLIHILIAADRFEDASARLQTRLDRRPSPLDSALLH